MCFFHTHLLNLGDLLCRSLLLWELYIFYFNFFRRLLLPAPDAHWFRCLIPPGGGVPQLLGRNPGKVCGPHSLKQNNRAAAKTKCARPSASPSLEQRSPDSSEARLCVPCAARFSTGGAGDAYFAETGGGRGTPCRDEEGAVSCRHSPRRSPLGMLCTISSGQFTGVTGLRV